MKQFFMFVALFTGVVAQAYTTSWDEAIIELSGVSYDNEWIGKTQTGQVCKLQFFVNHPHGKHTVYIFLKTDGDWKLSRFAEHSVRAAFKEVTSGDDHEFTELNPSSVAQPVGLQIQYLGSRAYVGLKNAPRDNTLKDRGSAHCVIPVD